MNEKTKPDFVQMFDRQIADARAFIESFETALAAEDRSTIIDFYFSNQQKLGKVVDERLRRPTIAQYQMMYGVVRDAVVVPLQYDILKKEKNRQRFLKFEKDFGHLSD